MANFSDQIKSQLSQIQKQIMQLVDNINNWPQYRKISAGIILLGIILLIIGIMIY